MAFRSVSRQFLNALGRAFRETGQACDRAGQRMAGDTTYLEKCAFASPPTRHGAPRGAAACPSAAQWNVSSPDATPRRPRLLPGTRARPNPVSRHRQVMHLAEKRPVVASDVFVAPSATVVGEVRVKDRASVWYNAVVRGAT